MRSRVELFEKIRRDRRIDEPSIRELADRHGVHRRTVRQALADSVPPPRKVYPVRPRPAIDGWATVIDAWLLADKDAPRKQRHTARRIWQELGILGIAMLTSKGASFKTGIFKHPVAGRVMLRQTNLDGDRQADLSVHGGANKAVYAYPSEHYGYWRGELSLEELPWGAFGENFTTDGQSSSAARESKQPAPTSPLHQMQQWSICQAIP